MINNKIKPKLRLFVEGQTENNYFKALGKSLNINFAIESIDMRGGGYSNFLLQVKKKGYSGCTAIFIIIDLDKLNKTGEKNNFNKLVAYCKTQNKLCPVPYFLIGTYADFEYFACCHCSDYKSSDTASYITNKFKYESVDKFKSDTKVYNFLNSNGRSSEIACEKLEKRQAYITNLPEVKKKKDGDIVIKNKGIVINNDVESIKNSNMYELFNVIKGAR